VPDLAVGAPGAGETWHGAVRVFSGVDGALLEEFVGGGGQCEFGISLAGGPGFDFDADGFPDLAVGEEEIYYGAAVSGAVHVFSSATHQRIFAALAGVAPHPYGGAIGPAYAIAAAGDFDGDGHSDLAVADPTAPSLLGPGAGRVRVLSGSDGSVLRRSTGTSSWDYLGYSIANAGDVDADGRPDLVLGAPTALDGSFSGGFFTPCAASRVRVLGPKALNAHSQAPRGGIVELDSE
jgi:hypothetical protein